MGSLLDPRHLIATFGYLGLFAIIFAESGLFFGFFLPGDSLLLTAGLLAHKSELGLSLPVLIPLLFVAAALGDQVGYWFGNKTGSHIFNRENSLLFRRKNLLAAKAFYEKHGGKTILLARFMPFIRTFAPIVAGAAEMQYSRFLTFNLLGALCWASGVTILGYLIGDIPGVETFFTPVVVLVIVISVMPAAIHVYREYREEIWRRIRRQPNPSGVAQD